MGFFRRAAEAVNTHYDIATDLVIALDPANRRVRKLEAQGTPANGVITGIRFSVNDVGFDDDPPPGSIAAEVEGSRGVGAVSGMSAGIPPPPPASGAPVSLDMTMQSWVDALRGGHMRQKDFDQALADWAEAGMCTPAHVAAARAAASA